MTYYLDHAATSPMRPAAITAWAHYASQLNPGGQYAAGRAARSVLDQAREEIAELLGADPVEVIFTASGTEACNLAVRGLFDASDSNRIITSPIEHPAVKESVSHLGSLGAEVELLDVDPTGHITDPHNLLATPAAVVAVMSANNETGARQPIAEIIDKAQATGTPVHIDAVQSVGREEINFHELGATTLAASAHKFGGPRGTGLLLARRSPAPTPVLFGGGQERGLRPGTPDVAGAAATAVALREALASRAEEAQRLEGLRDHLRDGIVASIDNVVINTVQPALSGHLNLSFPGAEGDSLLMLLDARGFAASTGSACHSGVNRASETLMAQGVAEETARGTLRFTLGTATRPEDIDELLAVLPGIVEQARLAGMA